MNLTRRAFLAAGASLALAACGGSSDAEKAEAPEQEAVEPEEEAPAQIVNKTTYYDVFRVDWRKGPFGDVEVYTANTMDFSGFYAGLEPDGTFSFDINGVPYNGSISLGKQTTHLYSGSDTEVTQLLFDGRDDATVGSVLIQGYTVDGYILVEMITKVDGDQVYATFYLWEHQDE